MDASTATGKLINTLKQQMRIKGLLYRDVASRLDVSEATVKRYLSGKGVTLAVLEQLAAMVDLDLLSLAAIAHQQDTTERVLTKEQLASLRANKLSLAVFWYLGMGFTPQQLVREFDLATQIDRILNHLQELGLIRRLSNNNVKLLVNPGARGFSWEQDRDARSRRVNYTRAFLDEFNLHDPRCDWFDSAVRLSPESMSRMREIIVRFAKEVDALTKHDLALPPEKTQWYRLFLGIEPVSRRKLFRYK